jgi:bifunctional ADP-heptose synthase (sugar kinase/adenylyltransferase)
MLKTKLNLDTRQKIISPEGLSPLLAHGSWTILLGEFDPLTQDSVDYIERVRQPGRKLLVAVRSVPGELLNAEARAVLLAGLRAVDGVVILPQGNPDALTRFAGSVPVIHELESTRRRNEFDALVLARQQA